MRFFLLFLTMAMFAYAVALFFLNTSEIAVNLLFAQVPAMNTAVLLVITFVLGALTGLLLSLLVFKVFQIRWENGRLKKEIKQLRQEQVELAAKAASTASQNAQAVQKAQSSTEAVVAASTSKDTDVIS